MRMRKRYVRSWIPYVTILIIWKWRLMMRYGRCPNTGNFCSQNDVNGLTWRSCSGELPQWQACQKRWDQVGCIIFVLLHSEVVDNRRMKQIFFLQPEKSLYVVGDILKCKFPVCSLLEGGETVVFCRLIVFSCCKSILVPWNVCWGRYIYYINIFFDLFFSHFYHKWAISDFLFLLLCCITQFCSSNGKD